MSESKDWSDRVATRGQRGSSPLGTTIFVGLRALDGFVLQRALQVINPVPGWFMKLGWAVPPPPPAGGAILTISDHALTPFQTVIWAMAIGSALKQIYWVLFTSKEPFNPDMAIGVSIFNTVVNSVNTLAFSLASINSTWSKSAIYTAIPIYVTGILIELISEVQRKKFKDDPKNDGKPYSDGLFGLARSINYFGYTMWRGAFALAGGGWVWGAAVTAFFAWDFTNRAIPSLDRYCSKRYGAQWVEVKKKVPYRFCPGIY